MRSKNSYEIESFGERGWLARLSGFDSDIESGLFANAVADDLRVLKGVTDAVAGIDSIVLRADITHLSMTEAKHLLAAAIEDAKPVSKTPTEEIVIPVFYGGEAGPDFDALCERSNLSAEELVKAHSAQNYRIITLGFAPGFVYLGPLDERLRAPRLDSPRAQLPDGSIGVAGAFTGVYSLPSPGGWRIIGRTPLALFDATSATPFIFKPGASVRFQPISENEFEAMRRRKS